MFLVDSSSVLVILAVLILALLLLLIWLKRTPLNLQLREPLFEADKRAFLGQLDIAVRSHLSIFPSLPVTDLLQSSGFSRGKIALNRLSHHRFDFVLCHRREMDIRCVVKLLPYGEKQDNKELRVLREACQSADLIMLEYEMKPYRDVAELRQVVFSACGIDEMEYSALDAISEQAAVTKPSCPKCHSIMELTAIKKGAHAGQECWICSTYPNCKGARLQSS